MGVLRDHRLQMQNHKKFTSCHGNARPDNTWIRIIKHQHKKTKTKVQETDLGPPTSKTPKKTNSKSWSMIIIDCWNINPGGIKLCKQKEISHFFIYRFLEFTQSLQLLFVWLKKE